METGVIIKGNRGFIKIALLQQEPLLKSDKPPISYYFSLRHEAFKFSRPNYNGYFLCVRVFLPYFTIAGNT